MLEKDISAYKRIVILGNGGSGKSFLTRHLADVLGYPVLHLDKIFWLPGWEHISRETLAEKQEEFVLRDTWIIDGNYASSLHVRMKTADLVIYLDMNRLVCFHGVISRMKHKRPDMPDYIKDKVDAEFAKWIWNFNKNEKPAIMDILKQYKKVDSLIIKGRKELKRFISGAARQES